MKNTRSHVISKGTILAINALTNLTIPPLERITMARAYIDGIEKSVLNKPEKEKRTNDCVKKMISDLYHLQEKETKHGFNETINATDYINAIKKGDIVSALRMAKWFYKTFEMDILDYILIHKIPV